MIDNHIYCPYVVGSAKVRSFFDIGKGLERFFSGKLFCQVGKMSYLCSLIEMSLNKGGV